MNWPGLLLVFLPLLIGCEQDLSFKIRFDDARGLKAGDPLVMDNQMVGKVVTLEKLPNGSDVAEVSVDHKFLRAATDDSQFMLDDSPTDPQSRQITIEQSTPGGKPIAPGTIVEGRESSPFGLPLHDIVKKLGGAVNQFREKLENFRRDFEAAPKSDEVTKLRDEWQRLMEEIDRTKNSADATLNQEVLPKLQKELEQLRKKLEEQRERQAKPADAKEI